MGTFIPLHAGGDGFIFFSVVVVVVENAVTLAPHALEGIADASVPSVSSPRPALALSSGGET